MNLPPDIREAVERHLALTIKNYSHIPGGCINNGGRIETSRGSLFIKWNDARRFPGMFAAEHRGLSLLASANNIRVPSVLFHGDAGSFQFIVMEFIEQSKASSTFWEALGRSLASLHRITVPEFGLDHNNYIGSLPQSNKGTDDWIKFFIWQRLEPQLTILNPPAATRKKFERLYKQLPEVFPPEPASLLHGDLWSGNLIKDEKGDPCLIDPAVYYGHREMELAFTQLFGGFDNRFYDTYKEVFPLQPGCSDRADLYNLYPLLVHANLFGGHYLMEIEEILARWTKFS